MKYFLLTFVGYVAASPLEIINYEDAEAGHGHKMSGVPGEMVQGQFYWKAPEGQELKLVYTADGEGFVATGDHLPVAPMVPVAPAMKMPEMVDYTPEVAEARSAFMKVFDEVKMRQVEENVVDEAVVAVERRRREAEADPLLIKYTQPVYRTYAPSYPHYYVYPVQQKQVVAEMKEGDMMKDSEEMDMVEEKKQVNAFYYAPSYPYYPVYPSVVYPQVSTEKKVVTSPVSVPSVQVRYPLYQYPQYYPSVQYPGLAQVSPVSPVVSVTQPERILPENKQEGEDEPAALLL